MSLLLNEEQTMLRDSARDFLRENAPVAQLRRCATATIRPALPAPPGAAFAELGFAGVAVPEAHGGTGLGAVEIGVLMEQIGRHLSALPFLSSGVVAARLLQLAGSPEQQAAWLPRIARGEAIATLALDEGPKHRPDDIALRAQAHAGGWRLAGTKSLRAGRPCRVAAAGGGAR